MKKQAFLPDVYDPQNWKYALMGAGSGFLGLSGIYALTDLLKNIGSATAPVPKLPKELYIDIRRDKDIEKSGQDKNIFTSIQTSDPGGWSKAMSFGFGLPLGVYGAYQLYD